MESLSFWLSARLIVHVALSNGSKIIHFSRNSTGNKRCREFETPRRKEMEIELWPCGYDAQPRDLVKESPKWSSSSTRCPQSGVLRLRERRSKLHRLSTDSGARLFPQDSIDTK